MLFLLTIWLPASQAVTRMHMDTPAMPHWAVQILPESDLVRNVFQLLDDDKLDREWVVRNVLGGMSAGFGLRGK